MCKKALRVDKYPKTSGWAILMLRSRKKRAKTKRDPAMCSYLDAGGLDSAYMVGINEMSPCIWAPRGACHANLKFAIKLPRLTWRKQIIGTAFPSPAVLQRLST